VCLEIQLCVKSLRSFYTGLYPQSVILNHGTFEWQDPFGGELKETFGEALSASILFAV